jgi:hypothetical protein
MPEATVSEAVEVAKKKGISIEGNPIEKVKVVGRSNENKSLPMGQDLDNKTNRDRCDQWRFSERGRAPGDACSLQPMITSLVKVIEKPFFKLKS